MEMENTTTQTQTAKPTIFKRKQRSLQTQQKSHMGNAVQESKTQRIHFSRGKRRGEGMNKLIQLPNEAKRGEEEDKEEVERKIEALQRIVPGGESLGGVDKLFEETAGYIMALQCQLKAMKALASFVEGLEKEKTKFGA